MDLMSKVRRLESENSILNMHLIDAREDRDTYKAELEAVDKFVKEWDLERDTVV
jgi:hypothetical protein